MLNKMTHLNLFIESNKNLLELERQEEINESRLLLENVSDKELQNRGVALLKLSISEQRTGMYGRSLVDFETTHVTKQLPTHSITPGDIVATHSYDDLGTLLASGIVTKVSPSAITVAFDENFSEMAVDSSTKYKLVKLANDVTYKRLKRVLNQMSEEGDVNNRLTSVLFSDSELLSPLREAEVEFINKNLDESQRDAVKFALIQPEVAIVHGPPGTGKTTTVIEIIQQAVARGMKVLATAPSNVAVDGLSERLAALRVNVVRLGHPARALSNVQRLTLDAQLSSSDEEALVKDVRKDIDALTRRIRREPSSVRRQLRSELTALRKELRQRETAAVRSILSNASVVLSTLTSASKDGPLRHLETGHFDITVVDECSQAIELACWIPLLHSPRCILAGDHLQLPPTIISKQAAAEGLELTLMERLVKLYGDRITRMLTKQYRMNELIMQWSSTRLYDNRLLAHQSVKNHLLSELAGVSSSEDLTTEALVLIDTAGAELWELDTPHELSKANTGEVELVGRHVESLVAAGVDPTQIAIISPYNLQVELLRLRLNQFSHKLEIKSVDGFQGREKEAVVLSLVRSNKKGEIGFLSEERRLNVAVTRARRHLCVVCDSATLSRHSFLQSLLDHMQKHGTLIPAELYSQEGVLEESDIVREHLVQSLAKAKASQKKVPTTAAKAPKVKKKSTKPTVFVQAEVEEKTVDSDSERGVAELVEELKQFIKSQRHEHQFSEKLNSFHRMKIHELAEQNNLLHVSEGQGDKRHIVVRKPNETEVSTHKLKENHVTNVSNSNASPPTIQYFKQVAIDDVLPESDEAGCSECSAASAIATVQPGASSSSEPALRDSSKCPRCEHYVPTANLGLHSLHCLNAKTAKKSEIHSQQRVGECSEKPVKQSGRKKKSKLRESRLQNADPDDFDALLAAVNSDDRKCSYRSCKVECSSLMLKSCPICSRYLCVSHFTPEAHGCGAAASEQARASRRAVTPSHVSATRSLQLERAIQNKRSELEQKRRPASGKKKKK